jgi:hypothetical protein
MYSNLSQAVAAERMREMRCQAAAWRLTRRARGARSWLGRGKHRAQQASPAPAADPARAGWPAQVPGLRAGSAVTAVSAGSADQPARNRDRVGRAA